MAYNIELLFPTPVVFTELGRNFTEKELDAVKKHSYHTYKNVGNTTSNNNYILEEIEFCDLKNKITECINYYVHTIYKPKNEVKAYITQSWLNYTNKHEFHHEHSHPNSFISGVLYIHTDETKDKITFSRGQYKQLQLNSEKYDIYNSDSWWFNVKTGGIVMFPSNLTHRVENVLSDETRISLAFNTFINGVFGDAKTLTELINE